MAKRKYYYSQPKASPQTESTQWGKIAPNQEFTLDLQPPFKFTDAKATEVFEEWKNRFQDEWHNETASINANNSLTQYNEYLLNRLSYAECSHLATDTIIHNAITKFTNECLRAGGKIIINDENVDADEIVTKLEKRMKKLNVEFVMKKAIETSLEYGNAVVYIDMNSSDLSKPFYIAKETLSANRVQNLKVVPPYAMGAINVQTANVIDRDYMRPKQWYIQGASVVDDTRLLHLVIFKCPDLIKPLYNFGGISLCQFMKNYVSTADGTRQALADIMLRFRTDAIKSDLVKINPTEAKARAESINRQKNNLGMLLLTKDEEFVQTITPISGLDKISAHQMEYTAVSARMPSVKLFGLTPSGFNATGDFDLQSYYDEIASIQNADLKPLMEQILRLFCLEMNLDIYPEYEFNKLDTKSQLEVAQIKSAYIDNAIKMKDSGYFTYEQGIEYLKQNEVLSDGFELEEEMPLDEIDDPELTTAPLMETPNE